ncbi:hypothetical protein H1C71_003182, partial [Ictidomys tridecemlineatus]
RAHTAQPAADEWWTAAASALGAHLGLSPGSDSGVPGLGTRTAFLATLAAPERPVFRGLGSEGELASQGAHAGRWCEGAGGDRGASPGLNREPCGHCSSHSTELGQVTSKHRLNYHVRHPYSAPPTVFTVNSIIDTVLLLKINGISFDTFSSFKVIDCYPPPAF